MKTDKFIAWVERYRRVIGLCFLFPSIYYSYFMYINFEEIQHWLFSLSGVDPENIEPAYEGSWIGLLSLTMLSACVGILLNKK
ncbi:MAG: hypothetical protein JJV99_06250 [Colwellia sp.]|nr:hypothetical protein [Colwellia sp.]